MRRLWPGARWRIGCTACNGDRGDCGAAVQAACTQYWPSSAPQTQIMCFCIDWLNTCIPIQTVGNVFNFGVPVINILCMQLLVMQLLAGAPEGWHKRDGVAWRHNLYVTSWWEWYRSTTNFHTQDDREGHASVKRADFEKEEISYTLNAILIILNQSDLVNSKDRDTTNRDGNKTMEFERCMCGSA